MIINRLVSTLMTMIKTSVAFLVAVGILALIIPAGGTAHSATADHSDHVTVDQGTGSPPSGALPAGSRLRQPERQRSKNGVLRTTLVADQGPAVVAGRVVPNAMTYNGKSPGPTLVVEPGDVLKIKLVNRLAEPTNLHTHGLNVSPNGKADNVFRHVMPGKTMHIKIHIPRDHPNGLYWYHPHVHGFTNPQLYAGMAGFISVEGGREAMPELAKYKQRYLAIQAVQFLEGNHLDLPKAAPFQNDQLSYAINGQSQPEIRMRPGTTQLWRIANMANGQFAKLNLRDFDARLVGTDGNPLDRPRRVKEMVLAPGNRIDVLVKAKKKQASLTTLEYSIDPKVSNYPVRTLVTTRISGRPKQSPPVPTRLRPFRDLRSDPIAVRRRVVLEDSGRGPKFKPVINGQTFDADRVDFVARAGTTEKWTLKVPSVMPDSDPPLAGGHPFHIHVNPFQVVRINGRKVNAHSYRDTLQVQPGSTIKILMHFSRITGKTVFHCHIARHEDLGMMAAIEITKKPTRAYRLHEPRSAMPDLHAMGHTNPSGDPDHG